MTCFKVSLRLLRTMNMPKGCFCQTHATSCVCSSNSTWSSSIRSYFTVHLRTRSIHSSQIPDWKGWSGNGRGSVCATCRLSLTSITQWVGIKRLRWGRSTVPSKMTSASQAQSSAPRRFNKWSQTSRALKSRQRIYFCLHSMTKWSKIDGMTLFRGRQILLVSLKRLSSSVRCHSLFTMATCRPLTLCLVYAKSQTVWSVYRTRRPF